MKPAYLPVLLLLYFLTVNLAGQNKGTLRILTIPSAEALTINDSIWKSGNKIPLEPGTYHIRAWYPDKAILDTSIYVEGDSLTDLIYRFKPSKEFLSFEKTEKEYLKKYHTKVTLPIVSVIVSSGAIVYTQIKGNQLRQELSHLYDDYAYARSEELETNKQLYLDKRKSYQAHYIAQYVEYSALALSSYFLFKGIKWAKKNNRPAKPVDKNPFKIQNFGVVPMSNNGYGIGLTLNLD